MYRNVQVTFDGNPNNARSESDVAVNPTNPSNMVGSSKRFTNIAGYEKKDQAVAQGVEAVASHE
jgi:hypothetical protein